jgi:signal transduction histidine kinase
MQDLTTILSFGITFGILIMTIIYTFIRYVYSKEIIYISYCFMQIFSLGFIVVYSNLFEISVILQELFLALASLSAIVFAVAFYEGKFFPSMKNYKELLLNTLLLNIVILTAFYHYMLFEYLPYTIIYAILFVSVIFNLKDGFKATIIYVIGWSIFCFVLFVLDFKELYIQKQYIDIVLLAFAIEAVLFTMSVSYKYSSLQNQQKDYENMLVQQSKLAKSGEMIGNITHQFRQPLNNLSYILMNLKKRFDNQKLDEKYFSKKTKQADEQLQFLSKTIDDFKEFYTPSKQKEEFSVKEAIENSITVLSAELKKRNITLNFEFSTNDEVRVFGIKNELSQAILAILSNASDALKDIEEPLILLKVRASNAEVIINIEDNAKGISAKNMEKIFEPYFTTKKEGSGIGLFLVKQIIEESFEGKIEVSNKNKGVNFIIYLEKI